MHDSVVKILKRGLESNQNCQLQVNVLVLVFNFGKCSDYVYVIIFSEITNSARIAQ